MPKWDRYRPSHRPSFRFRMLPSPFARFFAISPLPQSFAGQPFVLVLEVVGWLIRLQFLVDTMCHSIDGHKAVQTGLVSQSCFQIHEAQEQSPLLLAQLLGQLLVCLIRFPFQRLCPFGRLFEPVVESFHVIVHCATSYSATHNTVKGRE